MRVQAELKAFRELADALRARGVDTSRADELARAEIERIRYVARRPAFAARHGKFTTEQDVSDRADRLAMAEGLELPAPELWCFDCDRPEPDEIFQDTETCSKCGGNLGVQE